MMNLQERKHSHYCHEEEELVELESNICTICYLNLISAPKNSILQTCCKNCNIV